MIGCDQPKSNTEAGGGNDLPELAATRNKGTQSLFGMSSVMPQWLKSSVYFSFLLHAHCRTPEVSAYGYPLGVKLMETPCDF